MFLHNQIKNFLCWGYTTVSLQHITNATENKEGQYHTVRAKSLSSSAYTVCVLLSLYMRTRIMEAQQHNTTM